MDVRRSARANHVVYLSLRRTSPVVSMRVHSNGRYCGRRVAKLYAAGELFACRHCYGLAYESQQEPMHQRGLGKAQKIRMQMGGSQNMFEPFPDKACTGGPMTVDAVLTMSLKRVSSGGRTAAMPEVIRQ